MRPVHAVVLLLAGALSGAWIMKFAHRGERPVAPVSKVAVLAPPPLPVPATPAPPPAVEQPSPIVSAEPVKPKPAPAPRRVRPLIIPVSTSPAVAPPPAIPEPEPVIAAPVPPPQEPAPAAPAPQPHQVTLNAGMQLPVRLVDGLSSERNAAGDTFAATLDQELAADGFVFAERGARVEGRVVAVDRAKPRAAAALALELIALHTSGGQTVPIQTEDYFKHADRNQIDTPTKIAGGAVLGAVIGALAGGGKGAATGAGNALLAKGKPVELAPETLVTFRLKTTLGLTEKLQ